MFETFLLGMAVGERMGLVPALALLLALSALLALTGLQFRAVTSPDRSSKFVRVWTTWQVSVTWFGLNVFTMANVFVEGAPRTGGALVVWYIIYIGCTAVVVSALWDLFKLLRRAAPVRTA